MKELEPLREGIDQIDKEILLCIKKRMELVNQVGIVKKEHGYPTYDPIREKTMIAKKRGLAQDMGINPDVMEDILQRLILESYAQEQQHGFKKANNAPNNILIVGGKGKLGLKFKDMFIKSKFNVQSLDLDNQEQAPELIKQAQCIIFSVPIDQTVDIIKDLSKYFTEEQLLCDLTSVKELPLQAMLESHKGAVLGLHPMFGPDCATFAKQLVITVEGRQTNKFAWLLEQFKIWGMSTTELDANTHDRYMTYIQAVRHFNTFILGKQLLKHNLDLDTLDLISSPIYYLELSMIGRLFAQDAKLYADIIFNNKDSVYALKELKEINNEFIQAIEDDDKEKFITEFHNIKEYFGSRADNFFTESKDLIVSSINIRNKNSLNKTK